MSFRPGFIISLAANLVLGSLVYRDWSARHAAATLAGAVRVTAAGATGGAGNEKNSTPATEMTFDWGQLVSADFKIYRDRLRAVGCPEETVRDIITAEIDETFRQRRQALLADFQGRFWDLAAQQGEALFNGEQMKPLMELKEERDKLVADVLGKDTEKDERARARQLAWKERKYGWLPEEKRRQIAALDQKFNDQMIAVGDEVNKRSDKNFTAADQVRLKELRDERDVARKQLLTPEEQAEYDLRTTSAGRWAQYLPGFEASEDEWRSVAKLEQQYDEATKPGEAPLAADVQTKLKAELDDSIKSDLGMERFAQYELAADPAYQETRRVTQRYDLPEATAKQAYEMEQTAGAQARQLKADSNLSPEARQAALAAIRQETERSLAGSLGGKVFTTYQKYHGQWLKQLDQVGDE